MSDIRKRRYRDSMPPWANEHHMREVYRLARIFGYEVDHIVPINSKLVCGLHCRDNLQFLKAGANKKKSNKWWPDSWMEQEELFTLEESLELMQTRLIQL